MATDFAPIFMKDLDLILGDVATGPNMKCQIRSVKLTPDANVQRIKTGCPQGQYSESEDPEWTLEIGALYGRNKTEPTKELSEFLLTNSGKKLAFTFRPIAGGDGWTGTVTIVPIAIGGDINKFNENAVSLPLDGQPSKIQAVTP